MRRDPKYRLNYGYPFRVMGCLAAALLVMIALFRIWPVREASDEAPLSLRVRGQETIEISEIRQTRQGQSIPPPVAPLPPVAVPDELVLEDKPLDLDQAFLPLADVSEPGSGLPGLPEGTGATTTGETYIDPRLVGFAEPEYTREMRRKRVRAELRIRVLVDERGAVREAEITDRFLLSGSAKQPVSEIGFGTEEAVLAAIERCKFQPARRNGKPVEGYTTVTMSIAG